MVCLDKSGKVVGSSAVAFERDEVQRLLRHVRGLLGLGVDRA